MGSKRRIEMHRIEITANINQMVTTRKNNDNCYIHVSFRNPIMQTNKRC